MSPLFVHGGGAAGGDRLTSYYDNVPPADENAGWNLVVKLVFSEHGQFKIHRKKSHAIICPIQLYEETEDGKVIAWETSGPSSILDPWLLQRLERMLNARPDTVVETMDEDDVEDWDVLGYDAFEGQHVEPNEGYPGKW